MSDLVEQLRAQAVELRELHPIENPWAAGHWCDGCDDSRSLADLIDGMLGRHRPGGGSIGLVCMQDGPPMPCADLVDLARHVNTVLSGCTQTAREGR